MPRLLALPLLLALALGIPGEARAQVRTIGYDRFMSLTVREQQAAFREADPGTKAMLIRVHAQRWLDGHRAELSARQIAAVERGIAFITPELYEASPQDTLAREMAMTHSLECALGRANVLAAFTFFPPEPRTFWSTIENWLLRMQACLGR
jgi:tryptophan 2,3-dioxygenase